ncbi:unnamed protein product [Strongylus vulgaris]|uniref:Uncharacterized protein n=1 Tax=Strongylus vulgaris TaxID=40348 RepID=A0A3P7JCQ9_STRVU|nr:unnamed protein product [Strongylus vulgaris]
MESTEHSHASWRMVSDANLQRVCGTTAILYAMKRAVFYAFRYFAADLNADPKIFLQSAVISLTPNESNASIMHLRYYAQKEADSECVGPGEGEAVLLDNATLDVTIEYRYTLVPKFRNTMKFSYQVLYVDNQRAILYWCYRRASNGTCIQHDVNFMIRARHISHNDLSLILPYLEKVCIEKDNLRWFDLHVSYQVLYVDNQRAILYWCYRRASNGTCIQHDVNFMIRARHISHNDLSLILPYLEKVCIEKDNLRWFDLHAQCGSEMSASTQLRRDLVTLSHYDVLHILTNVQEPKCLAHEVKGVRADLAALTNRLSSSSVLVLQIIWSGRY